MLIETVGNRLIISNLSWYSILYQSFFVKETVFCFYIVGKRVYFSFKKSG